MSEKGMFYTNVNDYETKEDIMNDFIALRMYDMQKDKEIERLEKENERYRIAINEMAINICKAIEYIKENKDKYYQDWGEDDGSYDTYLGEYEINKLINILQGSDKE